MRLLLDTHVLLWWLNGDEMSDESAAAIRDPENDVVVSVVSAWEISVKAAKGRIAVEAGLWEAIAESAFDILPIEWRHAQQVQVLPPIHGDPFDRMLVAQGQVDGLVLVTRDPHIHRYDLMTMAA